MTTLIIDYGMGNLASVRRAVEECGHSVWISEDPQSIREASHLILPGVGAFGDGSQALHQRGWVPAIHQAVAQEGIPLLGICLGMQLLATEGTEGGCYPGLNLIPGQVVRFVPTDAQERIPHVGWNSVIQAQSVQRSVLFEGIADETDFYFVHSYHFLPQQPAIHAVGYTAYAGKFVSVIQQGRVFGTQFHPEKSAQGGLRLLKNFLEHGATSSC
ncbi:MAG: imidazole glycerol phosphate synthase subunit HisH [Candidatus Melainabacteria bacterium]|nr:imidazole glycerol phosphate synthase subunit HisH [Candidatus Melainabacteria bacterium]